MASPVFVVRLAANVTPDEARRIAESREARTTTALLNVAIAARRVVSKPRSASRLAYLSGCLDDLDKAASDG